MKCPSCHRPVKPAADPKAAVKCRHCGTAVWQSSSAGGGGYSLAEDSGRPGDLPPQPAPPPRAKSSRTSRDAAPPSDGRPILVGGLLALVGAMIAVGGYLLFGRPSGSSEQAAAPPPMTTPPPTVAPKADPLLKTNSPAQTNVAQVDPARNPGPGQPGKFAPANPPLTRPPTEPRGKRPTIVDPDRVPDGSPIDGWPPGVSEEMWDAALKTLRADADRYANDAPAVLRQERARLARLKAGPVDPKAGTKVPPAGPVTFASEDDKRKLVAECEEGIAWYDLAPTARTGHDLDHFVARFQKFDRVGNVGRIPDEPMKWSHISLGGGPGGLDRLPNAAWVYVPAYSPTIVIQLRNVSTVLFSADQPVRCPGVYLLTSLDPPTLTRVSFTAALRE